MRRLWRLFEFGFRPCVSLPGKSFRRSFFRPFGAGSSLAYPGLTPWAVFLRRFAAESSRNVLIRIRALVQPPLKNFVCGRALGGILNHGIAGKAFSGLEFFP